jgi:peptidoglycan/xylan/chitin deacetylase (PgdA/CDA1 family)
MRKERTEMKKSGAFWPNGARLVVSISMQFEAGAQPERGAESPFPVIDSKYPDLPAGKWYDYGFKEGIPRMLDMFDRVGVKATSHMVGAAVEKNPQLAKEIVERGHEAAGHGQTWTPQFSMTPEEEHTSYQASIKTIETATGTRPVGFNAFWLRGTPRTLEILQDLGFIYHIDDISRDEPFLVPVRNKPFVVVPYTIHTNDTVNYEGRHWTAAQFASELKYEFDQLYAEAATRRRMMSVSAHDRRWSSRSNEGSGRVHYLRSKAARRSFSTQRPDRTIRSGEFSHATRGLVDTTTWSGVNGEIEELK